jgi:hypothetical protein
MTGKKPCLV